VERGSTPLNGELQMRSPAVMLGYYKEPELTAQAFTADGWLHTGDKGQMDANGCLRITGRVKDLFKTSKGKYVAPAPIEDRLVMHPAIEACVRDRRQPGPAAGPADAVNPTPWRRPMRPAERVANWRPNSPKHLQPSTRAWTRTSSSTAWCC
jgi:long-chain acyl-CoA synthetase